MNLGDRTKEADKRDELHDRVMRSLTNITPGAAQIRRIELLRDAAKQLAAEVVDLCPMGREQSLAITHLEETVMWAVKSIVLEGEK